MSDLWVVKRQRFIDGVEVTTVITTPASKSETTERWAALNAMYQDPGNYYIEQWKIR